MSRVSFLILILSLGILSGLTGCGGSGGGGSPGVAPLDQPTGSYRDDSCDYGFTEGRTSEMSKAACPTSDKTNSEDCFIETTSFKKRYNKESLRQVLRVSAEGTVKFLDRIGADVYRAPRADDLQCSMFAELKAPSEEIASEWRRAARAVGGDENKSTLLGLYLDKLPSQTKPSRGTLLVIENGSRRVLVHEMMHHLFAIERQKRAESKTQEQMNMELKIALSDFQTNYGACPENRATSACTATLLKSIDSLLKVIDEVFVDFALEETTIETILLKALKAGSMAYISDFSESGYRYLSLNAERAVSNYEKQTKLIDELFRTYSTTIDRGSSDYNSLERRKAVFNQRIIEANNLKSEGLSLRYLPIPTTALLRDSANMSLESFDFHCNHGKEILALTEQLSL